MKTWKIPVIYQMIGKVVVEADTLEEAIEIAEDKDEVIPLPDDADYMEGSWEVEYRDVDYLRAFYNDNQEDDPKTKEDE